MLARLVVVLGLLAAAPAAPQGDAPTAAARGPDSALTTIFVVRHAEKDTLLLGSDPPLSAAGFLRAQELARVLGEAGVQAIYVTEFQRNRQTALPLASALGDSLRILRGRDFAAQAQMLKERHRGGTVLVIGHSDTVPQLVAALAGVKVRDFRTGEWDPIYVVTLGPGGSAKVFPFKYGRAAAGR